MKQFSTRILPHTLEPSQLSMDNKHPVSRTTSQVKVERISYRVWSIEYQVPYAHAARPPWIRSIKKTRSRVAFPLSSWEVMRMCRNLTMSRWVRNACRSKSSCEAWEALRFLLHFECITWNILAENNVIYDRFRMSRGNHMVKCYKKHTSI